MTLYYRYIRFRFLHTVLVFAGLISVRTGLSQCIYDINGDGIVNMGEDFMQHLGNFGVTLEDLEEGSEIPTDHNGNGISDIQDVIEFMPYMPPHDCITLIQDEQGVEELVLVEHYVHTTEIVDANNVIPAGSVTYRLYVHISDEKLKLNGIFGDESSPLVISASTSFFQRHNNDNTPTWDGLPNFLPDELAFYLPSLAYTSWLTIDRDTYESNGPVIYSLVGVDTFWTSFLDGNDLDISSATGGGIVTPQHWYPVSSTYPNLYLLGQFTTIGTGGISGMVNLSFNFEEPEGEYGYAVVSRSFSSDNLDILGCTDPLVPEYNPEATFDDGSCSLYGDIDGDGEISIEDLMLMISVFGCIENCPFGDLNNDGLVTMADFIIFLGLI